MAIDESLKLLYATKADRLIAKGEWAQAINEYKKIPGYDADQDIMKNIYACQKRMGLVHKPKPRPKKLDEDKPSTKPYIFTETFSDIIGLKRTKELVRLNILMPLKSPQAYDLYKMKKSAGILFYGPPGTGKTSMVRAISGEAKTKVVLARIDEIMSPYTAETERNMHKKFEEARKNAPCILFFDEMDALGAKRESLGGEGSAQILKQAVNVFLTEMDGIQSKNENVFVIGATNQPWAIDSGLKRGGRFDSSIYLPLPDFRERIELFQYYLKDRPRGRISYNRLARITSRYSPSDIKRICFAATKLAIGEYLARGQPARPVPISMRHLLEILRRKDTGSSSLDEWFSNTRKLLLGKVRVQQIGSKKQVIRESSELEQDERELYKELITDIRKQARHKAINTFIRLFSLYIA